jgi:hypothetical protein
VLGSLQLTGQPCEPVDINAIRTQVAAQAGAVQLTCVESQSRLLVRRRDGQMVQRAVVLPQRDAVASQSLLAVLIDEAMAVPLQAPTVALAGVKPPVSLLREMVVGPALWLGFANTGVMVGAELRTRGTMVEGWLAFGFGLSAGLWSEFVPEGQLSFQRIELIAGPVVTRRWGVVELAGGLQLRGGVLTGQGRAASTDFEARADAIAFVGVAAHGSVGFFLGPVWVLRLNVEPGFSVSGAVVTAGPARRGPASGWLVSSMTFGFRW